MEPPIRLRRVARVVTLDPRDRVLLLDTELVYTRVWMMPGGALKTGERHAVAARRELWEETGFHTDSLSRCVWTVRFKFVYRDTVYDQRERYFVARVDAGKPISDNREPAERSEIQGHRWWSLPEIAGSTDPFRPGNLAALLATLDTRAHRTTPISAPVESCAKVLR